MTRIAIVVSHVIQYQAPFFREIARDPELDLDVLYCSRAGIDTYHDIAMKTTLQWDVDLLSGYRYRFLRNFGMGSRYSRLVNPGVVPAIVRGGYDAVILAVGWGTVTSMIALAACRVTGTPVYVYGDSSFAPPEATIRQKLRGVLLRGFFRLTDGFLTSGSSNAAYYRHYGVEDSRMFAVPYAADNDRFRASAELEPVARATLRARFDVAPDDLLIVFSAKIIDRKDPLTLVRAVAMMTERKRTAILFLGDGELRDRVVQAANELKVRAIFPGFVNQSQLPRHYAAGDVLVLPSRHEPWGLVVNEAMACGLPVIASDRVGAAHDLVRSGENGWTFPVGHAEALAECLDRLAADRQLRSRMSERSRQIITTWDYTAGIRGIKRAVRSRC